MKQFCNPATLLELTQVKTSAEKCMIDTSPKLEECYTEAHLLLPATAPYLTELAKCAPPA